ncbi:MAG: FadR family transcriptional regulator [Firmicutes bacterium]|nr:FadR family transcriptional regulator [Bacillota bacterium]
MFKPIKNKKVYEHVIEQIQNMIIDGVLKQGDRLPSERELASQLNVSRTSIREALRSLQIIGLIESRQGEGNFIKENIDETLFEPLSIMFMFNKDKPEDILDLRIAIEVQAAYLAAKRVTEEDKKELENILKKLNKVEKEGNEKIRAKYDKEFHYKIAKITGNYFIINLLNNISSLMESFIIYAREKILKAIDDKSLLIYQHERIYNAIITNDSEKAASYMREHLELINTHLM